jgi:hypothetical protein
MLEKLTKNKHWLLDSKCTYVKFIEIEILFKAISEVLVTATSESSYVYIEN